MIDSSVSLFAHRAFMHFWYARLSGSAANQMMMVGVAWQMYDLTGSAWDLGLGTLVVAMTWMRLFPALARRETLTSRR